jgi:hypothetical protein
VREAPEQQQGETQAEVVYVLENNATGEIYVAWSRVAEPEAGQ